VKSRERERERETVARGRWKRTFLNRSDSVYLDVKFRSGGCIPERTKAAEWRIKNSQCKSIVRYADNVCALRVQSKTKRKHTRVHKNRLRRAIIYLRGIIRIPFSANGDASLPCGISLALRAEAQVTARRRKVREEKGERRKGSALPRHGAACDSGFRLPAPFPPSRKIMPRLAASRYCLPLSLSILRGFLYSLGPDLERNAPRDDDADVVPLQPRVISTSDGAVSSDRWTALRKRAASRSSRFIQPRLSRRATY